VDVIEVEIEAEWPVVKAGPDDACPALLDASWPDPADPSLYRTLERLARTHPDRGVFARVPGIFCQIERSLGFATFLQAVEKDSGFAGLIMERFVTLGATMVAEAVARGALALLLVEPLVTSSGDLATRMDHLEQWVFPFDQLLLGSVVREGVALVVECPRVHEGLWEWFRGLGARMIGPLRAADLQQLAENRGGRWKEPALYAALDSNVIARGTPDEIREHVRATCALAGPNRGLLLSATDVPPGTPMGSLEALLEAVDDCRY
jgi:uroporphyrinogen-III decarboxylase